MKAYMLEVLLGIALVLPMHAAYRNGYRFRRSVRIDHNKLPFDEPNFPVPMDLSRCCYGRVVFSQDAFGALPIKAEPDKTQKNFYWVTVPFVSNSTDTVFYMFYSRDKP
jgi:hypothetical protein